MILFDRVRVDDRADLGFRDRAPLPTRSALARSTSFSRELLVDFLVNDQAATKPCSVGRDVPNAPQSAPSTA